VFLEVGEFGLDESEASRGEGGLKDIGKDKGRREGVSSVRFVENSIVGSLSRLRRSF